MTIDTSLEALAALKDKLMEANTEGLFGYSAVLLGQLLGEADEVIEALEAERDALKFQQDEFHNVDDLVKIKKLEADLAHSEKHREQNRETAVAAIAERDAALAALKCIAGNGCCDGCQEAKRVAQNALAQVEHRVFKVCGDEGCDEWPNCRCGGSKAALAEVKHDV